MSSKTQEKPETKPEDKPEPNSKSKLKADEELKKPVVETKSVNLWSLYRYAGTKDKVFILLGLFSALAAGTCVPLMCVLVGDTIGEFSLTNPGGDFLDQIKDKVLVMVYSSAFLFVFSCVAEGCWVVVGDRIGIKVRILCLESIMKKPIEWFDLNKAQELPQRIFALASRFQDGIGEKVGKLLMSVSLCVSGITVSFIYGWKLALILVAVYPLAAASSQFLSTTRASSSSKSQEAYSKCSGYVDEVCSGIRVVYAFCAEQFEALKYQEELVKVQKEAVKTSRTYGSALGLMNASVLLTEGIGLFIGSYFVEYDIFNSATGDSYDCASVITVFFSGMFAMISFGLLAPSIQSIAEAKRAAYTLYEVVEDAEARAAPTGTRRIPLNEFKGRIEFKNVTFAYPANPAVKVLEGFSAVFEPDKTTGICGESGCGKSTVVQLIERFYKPDSGTIEVDGVDLNELDLDWWRQTVGFVDQDPVLFNATIKTNIGFGKEGATDEEIAQAAADANAVEFIEKLEKKYETETGLNGDRLSGGQKQRIAIARALVKKPLVFLLDEATSALDALSEQRVQKVFSSLRKTSVIVAHRLNTIRHADKILVISHGKVVESGTDEELREMKGLYANLRKLQEKPELLGALLDSSLDSLYSLNSREEEAIQEWELRDPQKAKEHSNKIWEENFKHKKLLFSAILFAILSGYEKPVSGALLGMVTFDLLNMDKSEMRSSVNGDFSGYIASAVGVFFTNLGVKWFFGEVTAKVISTVRNRLYKHILTMDVEWFDKAESEPGSVSQVLATDTEHVNNVVEKVVCAIIQAVSTLGVALAISFAYSVKMTGIISASIPFLILSDYISGKFQIGFAKQSDGMYRTSYEILSESVKNIRTIASFSNESRILGLYTDILRKALSKLHVRAIVSGLLYGLCQMIPFLIYAEVFYVSAWLLVEHNESPRGTFIAAYSLCFAALEVGSLQQYGPNLGRGTSALANVYGLLEQKPSIEKPKAQTVQKAEVAKEENKEDDADKKKSSENKEEEEKLKSSSNKVSPVKVAEPRIRLKGKIEFENVKFRYPTRKDNILKGLSLTIEAGENVALVGPSGSGKSTIIQLLERFYDVNEGRILIDGKDIREYPLEQLRMAIGYVPQEPHLFDTTIEENVRYSKQDATDEEVRTACRIADAIDFIEEDARRAAQEQLIEINTEHVVVEARAAPLSDEEGGFKRRVGIRGSLLSGGQKQRLSIARAILKDPDILLFDEATSALDTDTEMQVRKALQKVNEGKTTVTIAHRLTAIGDTDKIFVLEKGRMVESGTKAELMSAKGYFYRLYGHAWTA
eukprot:TRINITY_DN5728_c0_g1_i8.p1 TRINITY_DN5728_c0_g1~~TRINITY_DN5728_c0_g1_i8.p1  ORF type:complete len:1317 (+),score=412.45 TRINITY_DN5728_c0_g1_i8:235-4185(+)